MSMYDKGDTVRLHFGVYRQRDLMMPTVYLVDDIETERMHQPRSYDRWDLDEVGSFQAWADEDEARDLNECAPAHVMRTVTIPRDGMLHRDLQVLVQGYRDRLSALLGSAWSICDYAVISDDDTWSERQAIVTRY